jgi:uncharacterized membrane protein YfcA
METYIWVFLIIFIASIIQGMTSFVSSLFALPLLLFFLDIKEIVPLLAVYNLIMNSMIFRKVGKDADLKAILPLLISAIIFTIVGSFLLKNLEAGPIKLTVGIILFITSVSNLFGLRFTFKKPERYYIPVGIVSGALNGATGMSGPPVLLFLSNVDVPKKVFRSTLTSYFWVMNVIAITMFIIQGLLDLEVLKLVLYYVVALVGGTWVGIQLGERFDERVFKKIVLVIMVAMSINLIVNAF